jgi:ribulose-phosphate 3-epimerase
MEKTGTQYLQLGSFFELYSLDDDYFHELRKKAEDRGIRIKSVFTAHRELGGFFTGDQHLEKVARQNYEKLIHVASVVGADYCGSNPGAVYRDRLEMKEKGIATYLSHMEELVLLGQEKGLKALTIEPMSSMAEPPTTPDEMDTMMGHMGEFHQENPDNSVPVYLCGDISHGLANVEKNIVHSNLQLFEHGIPMMAEFHFKNTDRFYSDTFGFSAEQQQRGIIWPGSNSCVKTTRKNGR